MVKTNTVVRCSIYTRKSTEEGLEQEFNSLHAQREASEAYIQSQKHLGLVLLAEHYDDGGFTGSNLDRPALQRLLADIEARRVDCVVVYKVDRLSRSLLDFARLVDRFDQRSVSFVSVTQQLNTTTSLGRLTLNILLSFAQFEKELVSDRTRDKMSAARRKGKWVGGTPVLGYDVTPGGGRLTINEKEARRVREIFELYAQHGSLSVVAAELKRPAVDHQVLDLEGRHRAHRASVHPSLVAPLAHQRNLRGSSRAPRHDLCGRAGGDCRTGALEPSSRGAGGRLAATGAGNKYNAEGAAGGAAILHQLPASDDRHLHGQAWAPVSLLRLSSGPSEWMGLLPDQVGSRRPPRRFGHRPTSRGPEHRGSARAAPDFEHRLAGV